MGACNSVTWLFQRKEVVPYSDIDDKQVSRFCSVMKHCYNNIQSNGERNPLPVMRLPEELLFLLKELKKWIADKFPDLIAIKIIPLIHQEPIYRSPGASQQMVVARYSIWIETENLNAFRQGASRSHMLVWDDSVPPPQRFTSNGDWYIVSMDVVVDKIDPDGRGLASKNPKAHLKISIRIAQGRMTWLPTPANIVDSDFKPCFLKDFGVFTLNPEEWNKLHIRKWLDFKFQDDTDSIAPDPTEYNRDAIQMGHWNTNTSNNSNILSSFLNYITDFKPCFMKGFGVFTLDPEEWNKLHIRKWLGLNRNIPYPVTYIVPNPSQFNTGTVYKDSQHQGTYGEVKKGPSSAKTRAGGRASYIMLGLLAFQLFAGTGAATNGLQIKFEINAENPQNCTYLFSTCCVVSPKIKNQNVTGEKYLKDLCDHLSKITKANEQSLRAVHKNDSGTLNTSIVCNFYKDFSVTNQPVQHTFNGKELTSAEVEELPYSRIPDICKPLIQKIQFDLPETTATSPEKSTETTVAPRSLYRVFIVIFAVVFVLCAVVYAHFRLVKAKSRCKSGKIIPPGGLKRKYLVEELAKLKRKVIQM